MVSKFKIPLFFKFSLCLVGFILVLLSLYRIVFWQVALQDHLFKNVSEMWKPFLLGLRFDVKFSLLMLIPLFIITFIFRKTFFASTKWKRFYLIYLGIAFLIIDSVLFIDIFHFQYLRQRLNASSLLLLANFTISMKMMWQSYPLVKIFIGLLILIFIKVWFFGKIYHYYSIKTPEPSSKKGNIIFAVVLFLLSAMGIYNSFSHYPLRWSEAFFTTNKEIGALALNPGLYFIETLNFAQDTFDKTKTQAYYPTISKYLEVENPNLEKLNFSRSFSAYKNDSIPASKNIVFVMMESLGAPNLGCFNNPMEDGSPFLNQLSKDSWFFTNFYVPKFGTARTVFTSITGLPDITLNETASRNPVIIDQKVIMNQWKGVEKMYFLGGSANWANIRSVFTKNIQGINIFEEGSYENENRVDVWGISDDELFTQAHNQFEKLTKNNKNFVAYVQSSAYHPPYTIANAPADFKMLTSNEVSIKQITQAGFESLEHYNSLRFFDYNLKKFFDKVKTSNYYKNTTFILFGDHNGHTSPFHHMKNPEFETGIQETHVPLYIYGPNIKPKTDTRFVSLVDIMPTAADLLQKPYTNYTLGKSILRRPQNDPGFSFVFTPMFGKMSAVILYENYLGYFNIDQPNQPKLLKYTHADYKNSIEKKEPILAKKLDSLAKGMYYSTQYLFFNNKN